MPTINFILSISLISTFCWVGINGLPINFAMAETTSEQQESPTSLFDKIRNAITDKKPPVTEGKATGNRWQGENAVDYIRQQGK